MSWFLAPSRRGRRPGPGRSGRRRSLLMMISSNCSGSTSRPRVVSGTWISWPAGTGGWPICPVATWTFCLRIAWATSAGGHVAGGQLLGVDPDPHAVVALAEHADVADARQAGDLVLDLHQGVVAQEELVAAVWLGRVQRHGQQDVGRLLPAWSRRSA